MSRLGTAWLTALRGSVPWKKEKKILAGIQ